MGPATQSRRKAWLLGALGALALGVPGAALACSPALGPPPTPEEAAERHAAYELAAQQALWRKVDHVFLARIFDPYSLQLEAWEQRFKAASERAASSRRRAAIRTVPPPPPPPMIHWLGEGKTTVVIEPLQALKGAAPLRRFEIRDQEGWTSCGPLTQFDVFRPEREGGLYVVFVSGAYPTQDSVLEAMAVEKVVDPDIKAAMAAAGAP